MADLRPGSNPSPGPPFFFTPSGFVAVGGGRAVFWTSDGTYGSEPWITDGTAEGTYRLADVWPGGGGSNAGGPGGSPGSVIIDLGDGRILFSATDPIHGTELWVSDLTAEGTQLAADINTTLQGFGSSSPGSSLGPFQGNFAVLGEGRAVFVADDGVHGREAWISDGTPEGTQMLADITPAPTPSSGSSLGPTGFTPVSPPDWAM